MYNTEKLKARIVEKFGSQKAFAKAIGTTPSTICKYLAFGRDWKGSLLIKAIKALEISDDEVNAYFFTPAVAKTPPRKK
jgi:hypothetical protein